MPPYDSESSGDDESDYTLTNVLLGYASAEPRDDEISQLGGRPTWIDLSSAPSAALAKCKICSDLMVLLLQLNGELPDFPGHERRLYVFTCRRKTCRRKEGSVRALRGVRISAVAKQKSSATEGDPKVELQPAKPSTNFGETLFGAKPPTPSSSTNPFSMNNTSSSSQNPFFKSSVNPFALPALRTSELAAKPPLSPPAASNLTETFATALSLNDDAQKFGPPPPPEPWPQDSDLPSAYPPYFLDPDYEELDKADALPVPTQTMDIDEGNGFGGQKEEKDAYEDRIDKTFQKFADRLAQNAEQVLRYEFKGQPLLYSKSDGVGRLLSGSGRENAKITTTSGSGNRIPRCTNCGAGRVFEVQLTPHAIMELERDESGLDGMEWGTIIVGVCEKDCQQRGVYTGAGYIEEWVGVQWEELGDKR